MKKIKKQDLFITTSIVAVLSVAVGIGALTSSANACVGTTSGSLVSCSEEIDTKLTIDDVISLTLSDNGTTEGTTEPGAIKVLDLDATVNTNSLKGYVLSVKDNSASSALTSTENNTIETLTGTSQSTGKALDITNGSWGIRGGMLGSTDSDWRGMPTSSETALKLKDYTPSSSASEPESDTTKIFYGIAPRGGQPSGTYSTTMIYTATTKTE